MNIAESAISGVERFWIDFVSEHWEQRPLVMDQAPVSLGMDAREAFALTVAAFDHPDSECRFFADGMQLFADVRDLWPSAADADWDGFASRMASMLGDADYLLIANHVQALDFSVFDRARSFLYGLHEAGVGLPSDFADVDIIAGRYASTPHGVHRDPGCSFMAGLKGEKSMVTWPGGDDRITEFTRRYEQWLPQATVLPISEGSLVYWPSSAWHVGESPAGLSVTASVALYGASDPLSDVSAVARGMVDLDSTEAYPWSVATPGDLERARSALVAATSSADFAAALQEAWLSFYTAGGFASPPGPDTAHEPVGQKTVRLADARFPVATAIAPGGKVVAANGQVWRIGPTDALSDAIEQLNGGKAVTAVDKEVSKLISRLMACRAVTPTS